MEDCFSKKAKKQKKTVTLLNFKKSLFIIM